MRQHSRPEPGQQLRGGRSVLRNGQPRPARFCGDASAVLRCGPDLLSASVVKTCPVPSCDAGACTNVCAPGAVQLRADDRRAREMLGRQFPFRWGREASGLDALRAAASGSASSLKVTTMRSP